MFHMCMHSRTLDKTKISFHKHFYVLSCWSKENNTFACSLIFFHWIFNIVKYFQLRLSWDMFILVFIFYGNYVKIFYSTGTKIRIWKFDFTCKFHILALPCFNRIFPVQNLVLPTGHHLSVTSFVKTYQKSK